MKRFSDRKEVKRILLLLLFLSGALFSQENSSGNEDIVVSPLNGAASRVSPSGPASLEAYLRVMSPRVERWKAAKERGQSTLFISDKEILEESKLVVDAWRSLSREDLARFYQLIGDYFFAHNKTWPNVEMNVDGYLRAKDYKSLKDYLIKNQDIISANYNVYLSNVINSDHQLIIENLEKYKSSLMKIYTLTQAYLYGEKNEGVYLINLYHAYVLYFYRSRGVSSRYFYLDDMKNKDIISAFSGSSEFRDFATLKKMENLARQKSMFYLFCMSDLRKDSAFFPYLTYKNDAEARNNFNDFVKSDFFLKRDENGDKAISRLLYVYFSYDYGAMLNFIKDYREDITLADLEKDNTLDLSNEIKLSPDSLKKLQERN